MTKPEFLMALEVVITVGCGIIIAIAFAGVIGAICGLTSGIINEDEEFGN